jgi:hypothetical protein
MHSHKIWMLAEGYDWNTTTPAVCDYRAAAPLVNVAVPPPRLHEMVITIKILPSSPLLPSVGAGVEARLSALVDSMLAANYTAESRLRREERIDVELHRFSTATTTTSADDGDVQVYDRILKKLQAGWAEGHVRLVDMAPSGPLGGVEQFLATWAADSDREAALMIDDQLVVSPLWWRWVRYGVGAHYCNLDMFTTRLFGVVLESNVALVANSAVRFKWPTCVRECVRV